MVILIVGLGLGYAYINSDLNINGTAQVNSAFGTSNCVNYSSFVHCSVSGLESYADKMGNVYANDFSWTCTISSEGGSSYCDENNVG